MVPLLQLLPDRHMVRTIMEMVANHRFNLATRNGKGADYDPQEQRPSGVTWRTFSSTSSSLICQPLSPESMHMLPN